MLAGLANLLERAHVVEQQLGSYSVHCQRQGKCPRDHHRKHTCTQHSATVKHHRLPINCSSQSLAPQGFAQWTISCQHGAGHEPKTDKPQHESADLQSYKWTVH